jgi:hypothetical protein
VQKHIWTKPHSLHDTWAETFHDRISDIGKLDGRQAPVLSLQIQSQRRPASRDDRHIWPSRARSLDPQHLSPKIGQQHDAKRSWPYARKLDDAQALQWPLPDRRCFHVPFPIFDDASTAFHHLEGWSKGLRLA